MRAPSNLFASIPANVPDELIQTLLATPSLRIERIVSDGHASPEGFWYDQKTSEWVLLIQGSAWLRFEGEEPFEMIPGSYIQIPAHKRHRVESTDSKQQTVWVAIHYDGAR